MNLDRLRLLHLRRLWRHRLRTLASVIGIAMGVALVVATAALMTSSTATANATVALLGGARYELTVPAVGLETSIAAVTDVDAVSSVRRYIETPIMVGATQAWLVALDRPSEGVPGELNTSQAQRLSETTGIRTGSALASHGSPLFTGPAGLPVTAQITGPVDSELASRFGGRMVAADIVSAETLRGAVGTETLLVYGNPEPSQLTAAVPGSAVRSAEARVAQARNTMGVLFESLSIFGALGLVVGGFMLFNTMNMSVLERRHEIASLRALGATRRFILTGVLAEAAVLGVAGSIIGVGLGALLARVVIGTVPDAFSRGIGTPLQTSVPAWLVLVATGLGVITAAVSAILPARRAVLVEPLEALRPDTATPADHGVRLRLWLIAVGVALTVLPSGQLAIGAAMVGLLCVVAGAAPLIASACVAIAATMGPSGELAAASLRRSPRRVWGTATVVILAVSIAVTTTGVAANLIDTTGRNMATALNSDFWVSTTTGDTIATTGLPPEWTDEFASIPGVAAVAGTRWLPTETGDQIVGVIGVYGDSGYPFSRLADDQARAAMAVGEGVIVVKQTALIFDYAIGDVIDIPGAVPPLRLPIVAITPALSPVSGGTMNISHDLMIEHFGIESLAQYEIQLEPAADAAEVRARLEAITRPAGSQIQIYTGQEFFEQITASADQTLSLVSLFLAVIVGCAAIALLNTLLASTLERTREIATLRAIGATKRRIVVSIAAEALAIGITGSVIGAVAGSVDQIVVVRIYQAISQFGIDYAFSPIAFIAAIGTGIAIAVVGAITPCRSANRLNILDALSD